MKKKDNILKLFGNYFIENDYNEWLNQWYDDVSNIITEKEFYAKKYFTGGYRWDIPPYSLWKNNIYERLTDSIELNNKDIEKVKQIKGITNIEKINDKKLCFKITYNDELDESSFIHFINFYGYTLNNIDNNTIIIEAYIPKRIKYNKDYIYHVTTKNCYNKIKKVGLLPYRKKYYDNYYKETNKTILEYPERIYVWKEGVDKNTIQSFINLQKSIKTVNNNIDTTPIILKINIQDLNKYRNDESKISFYTDPAYTLNTAIFTMEPIPSKYIEEISIDDISNINESKKYKHKNIDIFK